MSDNSFDVLVIGAGMVGSATAAQLALRGMNVGLIDRQAPGEGTSYGNAGVIDSSAFLPTPFPRHFPTLMRYALGRTPHLNFHPSFLPQVAPWLFSYWRESTPKRMLAACERLAPLARHAVGEHTKLASAADASALIRHTGWAHLYRTAAGFDADAYDRELLSRFDVAFEVLDTDKFAELEPHIAPVAHKVTWIKDSASTSDPGQLTKAYAGLVTRHGGRVVQADAKGLMRGEGRWLLLTEEETYTADQVVIALGPWAKDFLKPFDIDVPIAVKRGYHMHFTTQGNATMARPVADAENGFCLTPMTKGIRMTTGAEFAHRDAKATPVQIGRAEKVARTMLPALGAHAEAAPWLGRRPNTPDGAPIIGAAPGQPGMWLAVGHGHWGLALGPATGRLVADLVAGTTPVVDPKGLGVERFR